MAYTPIITDKEMYELQRYTYAMTSESFSNPITALSDAAIAGFNHVTGTLQGITQSFKTLFNTKVEELELDFSPSATAATLSQVRYIDMVEMMAYTPAGLQCRWKVYLDVLCLCAGFLTRAEKEFLVPYRHFVTDVLGGKFTNSIVGFSVKTQEFTDERLKLLNAVSELFVAPDGKAAPKEDNLETSWGKVVANNSEWDGVCKLSKHLIDGLDHIKRGKLKEGADKVSRVLDGIMKNQSNSYSAKMLEDITKGGIEYVNILEFYSVTYYRALTVLGAIKNTSEHIRATLTNK
jgi:hypothetical protein